MNENELEMISGRIGHRFKNYDLLQQAFVRRSYSQENGGGDNELLEFIGDRALDIAVTKFLIERFGYFSSGCDDYNSDEEWDEFFCEYSEGRLTHLKSQMVSKKSLAKKMTELGFERYLILGNGDKRENVGKEASVKEDLFEAIIGAVALDCNWGIEEIQSVVEVMLEPESFLQDETEENYVELLQEWSCRRYGQPPEYHFDNASYDEEYGTLLPANVIRPKPDYSKPRGSVINIQKWYDTHFKCRVEFTNISKVFIGFGESKTEARKSVAKVVYDFLENNDLLFTINDEISNPNKNEAINQLEILARRGYFSIPTYDFEELHDEDGNPIWRAECHIAEYSFWFDAESSSKKEAKKLAAIQMLMYVLEEEE